MVDVSRISQRYATPYTPWAWGVLRRAHAYRVLIGAGRHCNPMLCPIHAYMLGTPHTCLVLPRYCARSIPVLR